MSTYTNLFDYKYTILYYSIYYFPCPPLIPAKTFLAPCPILFALLATPSPDATVFPMPVAASLAVLQAWPIEPLAPLAVRRRVFAIVLTMASAFC